MKIEHVLRPDERMIREFTISPKFFIVLILTGVVVIVTVPMIFILFNALFVLGFDLAFFTIGSLIGFLVGGALIAYAFYFRVARHYVLTNQRTIGTIGWLSKRTISVDYEMITDLRVNQDLFERLVLGTGMVCVNTAGGDLEEIFLERVDEPYRLSNQIRQLAEARHRETQEQQPEKRGYTPPQIISGPSKPSAPGRDGGHDGT